GPAPLHIKGVISNCSCAEVDVSPLLIPSKGAGTLRVKVATPPADGAESVLWPIVVDAIGAHDAQRAFTLKARIRRAVTVTPRSFHLADLKEGFETQKLVVSLRPNHRDDAISPAPAYLDAGLRWGGHMPKG